LFTVHGEQLFLTRESSGCGYEADEVAGDPQDVPDKRATWGQRHGGRIAREVRRPPGVFGARGALLNLIGIGQFRWRLAARISCGVQGRTRPWTNEELTTLVGRH
jgi:hypothetical protein